MSTTQLNSPDLKRCQTEMRTNNTFRMGGRPEWVRCENAASWVATENKPGADGRIGSMSLCDDCKAQMLAQLGEEYANFERISREAA